MKIVYLLTWPFEMGGTERSIITQAEAMAHRHQVEIVGVISSRPEPFFPIPTAVAHRVLVRTDAEGLPSAVEGVDLPPRRLEELHAAPSRLIPGGWESAFSQLTDLAMTRWLRELDCDVLVTTTPALLAIGSELAPHRVVVVHQEHRTSERRGATLAPLMSHGPRVDAVAFLTTPSVEHFRDAWGSAAPTLIQVLNPLTPDLRPVSGHKRPLIVAAGRLTAEKRFDHLIDAFAPIAEAHPQWTLRLFGSGPQEPALRRQISRKQLTDQVEIMGPSSVMSAEWAAASIAALSSRNEGLSLVIQEAMAAGTPVVSYACPNGPAQLITHGVDGLLVENGNVGELTTALISLVRDGERRQALGEAARLRARAFAAETIAETWEGHFLDLLADVRDGETRLERVIRRTLDPPRHRPSRRDAADDVVIDTPLVPPAAPSGTTGTDTVDQPLRPSSREKILLLAGSEVAANTALLPEDARQENLRIAVEAIAVTGSPGFRLPGPGARTTIVVPDRDRRRIAEALSRAADVGGLYVAAVDQNGRASRGVLTDEAYDFWRSEPTRVRLFRRWADPQRTLLYGAELGCDLAFWHDEGDHLVGHGEGIVSEIPWEWLTERTTVTHGGVPVAELSRLSGFTSVDTVTFDIDAVYTWVDGSDPAWLTTRRSRRAEAGGRLHLEADSEARYRSRDELRYSLRSLEYHAPWVRHVFLVTAGQVPSWVAEDHPGLTIVDHRDLFQRPADLPTFNSHAIESQLHHIDGLADHFLYVNDDVFFGRPVSPDMFFTPGGLPRVFKSPTLVGFPSGEAPPHVRAALNNRALLRRDFGRTITNGMLHVAHPMRRSLLTELEERYPVEYALTAGHPFRHDEDLSVTSSLVQHYGLLTGQAVYGNIRAAYVGLGGDDIGRRLGQLLTERNFDVFSIGDFHDTGLPEEEVDDMVRSFLQAYWPFPGRYES
ncbi:stealth conserved region 3 domain-containing protein [Modestobacter marinus]|uniref:Exopolysaccharide phosphotransferase n=1 Tax=Modestobacter marinus TaxID=477641 RepID=A0A846LJV0_9ACTN|nr:stealth conserved region 3 domain-containing protein [Modestobacter marinus]NIH67601.1 glycosyltransferase involved in cell wall biosynthesis [Modestobacter marinus]GGL72830.1 exopolysaccharide phosphotransferase [Modestobacter marinus]